MRSRKGDLTLIVIGFILACARMAGAAGPGELGFSGQDVPLELAPAEGEIAYSERQFLPGPFAASASPEGPMWYFQVEGLALKRDASADHPFQALVTRVWTEDPPGTWTAADTPAFVLGTNDLDFGFQGGGRGTIGRRLGDYHAFEATYFQVTDWDEIAAVRDSTQFVAAVDGAGNPTTTYPASLFSPFSDFGNPAIIGLDYNNLAEIRCTSSLSNIEWNLRRWLPMPYEPLQVSVLVGGRYMDIGETFLYHTESAVPVDPTTNTVTTATENTMLGVQIGALFEFHVEPAWWIDCEIKGAAFNNAASQDTVYVHAGDPGSPYAGTHTGRREEQTSAFALDLRLSATLQVTECLAVHGGYNALWVDGLVLASDNLSQDIDILTSGPATLVDKGKTVYHGPHLGLSWIW
ncbi:MAG: BBP7 family outer membrane beta-barrel protein [Planctomycetota bacterium]